MGRKSRHCRDASDPLLGLYSSTLAASSYSSAVPNPTSNIFYDSIPTPTCTIPPPPEGPSATCGSSDNNVTPSFENANRYLHYNNKNHSQHDFGTTNDESLRALQQKNSSSNAKNRRGPTKQRRRSSNINDSSYDRHHHVRRSSSTRSFRIEQEQQQPRNKSSGYRVHRVSYTAQNHVQVLFRMYGSAFPQVLPFCAINVLWTFLVVFLKNRGWVDLTFHSSIGHSFMGLLVSFLVVSRSKISYDRFMDFRRNLATTYRVCRDLSHLTTVYTLDQQTPQAQQWRQDVCFRTILLLRVTLDALLWSSTEREQWTDEYYRFKPEKDGVDDDEVSEDFFNFRRLNHGRRSLIDEHFRAPITFQYELRRVIMQHPQALGYKMAVVSKAVCVCMCVLRGVCVLYCLVILVVFYYAAAAAAS